MERGQRGKANERAGFIWRRARNWSKSKRSLFKYLVVVSRYGGGTAIEKRSITRKAARREINLNWLLANILSLCIFFVGLFKIKCTFISQGIHCGN